MPVIRTITAERGIDIGGIPSTQVDDSVGRGLRQVGNAVSAHGEMQQRMELRRMQMGQQIDEFRTNQAFQRWNDDNELEFAKTQQEIDPSGQGFTDTVSSIVTKRSEEFLQSVPENLRPKFAELVTTSREQWLNKAAAAEIDQRNSWYRTGITERQTALQMQVGNDPEAFNAARDDAFRTIDTSGLPPAEKEALKKKTEEMFSLAVGESAIRRAEVDPDSAADAAQRLGLSGIVPRGQTLGQGGSPNTRTFLLSRTDKDASHIDGLDAEFGNKLAAMMDAAPAGIREGLGIYSGARSVSRQQELWDSALKKYGSAAAARKWVAPPGRSNHNHGKAADLSFNGKSLSRAPKEVVEWVHSNAERFGLKFPLANENWHIEDASTRGGKGGGKPDPRYANLTLDQRLSIYDQTQAAAKRGQTAIAAQQKTVYDAEKGALELGIQTGDVSSPIQIMQSGMSDAHKADLLSALRTRQGDTASIAEAVASFQNGTLRADPYSSDDRKTVDGVYDVLQKSAAPEQLQGVTEDLIATTGIVPQKVHNALRAGLESTVPAEVEAAAQQAARIAQISPSILGRREGGAEVQKKADLYDTLTRSMGYPPDEAAKRMAEANDPEKARQRSALMESPAVKEMLKKVDSSTVAKAVSGVSLFSWKLGENEAQTAAMVSEYKSILQETIVDANGDETAARELANKRFDRLYGASELTLANVGFRNVITRLPPEKVYEPMPDGSFDYIEDQLREALTAEGVQYDDIRLSAYEDTDADFQNGEPARYQVWYEQNGEWQLYNLPFFADRSAALSAYDAEQNRLLDERRAAMEANRAEEERRFPEGREGPERFSNDDLYFGIARDNSPMGRAIRRRREADRAMQERIQPDIDRDRQERQDFDALDPDIQRERLLDEYLSGPLMPPGGQ